jgi:hypothetical protein
MTGDDVVTPDVINLMKLATRANAAAIQADALRQMADTAHGHALELRGLVFDMLPDGSLLSRPGTGDFAERREGRWEVNEGYLAATNIIRTEYVLSEWAIRRIGTTVV